MNKYERLFKEILGLTKAGQMKWRQVRRDANNDVVFNPGLVFRQYVSTLPKAGHQYTVILVEKKFDDPAYDFEYQTYLPEILITDEGDLIASLTDSVVDRMQLIDLANTVESRSDKASRLFGD